MMFLETETEKTVMSGQGRVRARGLGRGAGAVRGAMRGAGPGRRAGPRRGQGRGIRLRGGASDEIRATIIDHVINHGLSPREGW